MTDEDDQHIIASSLDDINFSQSSSLGIDWKDIEASFCQTSNLLTADAGVVYPNGAYPSDHIEISKDILVIETDNPEQFNYPDRPQLNEVQINQFEDTLMNNFPFTSDAYPRTPDLPSTKDWSGMYDFDIFFPKVKGGSNKSASYAYSEQLKKLFIAQSVNCMIEFKINYSTDDLYIRAMAVYEKPGDMMEVVKRCAHHLRLEDTTNNGFSYPEHFIRCESETADYCFDERTKRYSVLIKYCPPAAGTEFFPSLYKFMCLGSCVGGINRRPLLLIFTLESNMGEVLGRKVFHLRVCACPSRDLKTEEAQLYKTGGGTRVVKRCSNKEILPIEPPNKKLKEDGQPEVYEVTFRTSDKSWYDWLITLRDKIMPTLNAVEPSHRQIGFTPNFNNSSDNDVQKNKSTAQSSTSCTATRSETVTREQIKIKTEQSESIESFLANIGMETHYQTFLDHKLQTLEQLEVLSESGWEQLSIEQEDLETIRNAVARATNLSLSQDSQSELICISRVSFKRVTSIKREDHHN